MCKGIKKGQPEKVKLIDRIAVAVFSGLAAFVSGMLLWTPLFLISRGEEFVLVLFKVVLGFTIIMTVLGFMMMENLIVKIFSSLWKILAETLGIETKGRY